MLFEIITIHQSYTQFFINVISIFAGKWFNLPVANLKSLDYDYMRLDDTEAQDSSGINDILITNLTPPQTPPQLQVRAIKII